MRSKYRMGSFYQNTIYMARIYHLKEGYFGDLQDSIQDFHLGISTSSSIFITGLEMFKTALQRITFDEFPFNDYSGKWWSLYLCWKMLEKVFCLPAFHRLRLKLKSNVRLLLKLKRCFYSESFVLGLFMGWNEN